MKKTALIIILLLINVSCVSTDNEYRYCEAMTDVKNGKIDFAFIKLTDYLRDNPQSPRSEKIKFAIAEYYLQINNYHDAILALSAFINEYPKDRNTVFAKALLYNAVKEYQKDTPLTERIKKEFFSSSIFLTFSEAKIKEYKSILNNTYKIAEYIDKIEIFKNNDLLFEITP